MYYNKKDSQDCFWCVPLIFFGQWVTETLSKAIDKGVGGLLVLQPNRHNGR